MKDRRLTVTCLFGILAGLVTITASGQSTTFRAGDSVFTTDYLNVRPELGTANSTPRTAPPGSEGSIVEHASNGIHVDGHHWWYWQYAGERGWSAGDWLTLAADGFDYPVGPRDGGQRTPARDDGDEYYVAQFFGPADEDVVARWPNLAGTWHLGEDWNRDDLADYGDPVYAAATGRVSRLGVGGGTWGTVATLVHYDPDVGLVASLYGHLSRTHVAQGDHVVRGQLIGEMGKGDGSLDPHLHFEIRDGANVSFGPGYATDPTGWTDPSDFIDDHRPLNLGITDEFLDQVFEDAGSEFNVPSNLLRAIAHVESNWLHTALPAFPSWDGGWGIMQLTSNGPVTTLEEAAGLIGAPASLLTERTPEGTRANVKAAAAWMAQLFDPLTDYGYGGPLVFDGEPREALESWWWIVTAYNGGGLDGDLSTSNYPYRVYNVLRDGYAGRTPSIDVSFATFTAVSTNGVAAPHETTASDVALYPPVSSGHIRKTDAVDVTTLVLHNDAGMVIHTPPSSDSVPVILEPADGAVVPVDFVYRWEPVASATKYLWSVLLPRNIAWFSIETTDPAFDHGLTAGTYQWQVAAYVNGQWAEPSAVHTFTRMAADPPILISPDNGSTLPVGETQPKLIWDEVEGAMQYAVQGATDVGFTDLLPGAPEALSASKQISVSLEPGTYYWRVRTGEDEGAVWSAVWSFTVPQQNVQLAAWAEPDAGGSIDGADPLYVLGATAILTATPAAGYRFDGWSRDAGGDDDTLTLSMDTDLNVVALFVPNAQPAAHSLDLVTREDTPLEITLSGNDADGDFLTYRVVTPPQHGQLPGSAPSRTYTPSPGYAGEDYFEYVANDGVMDSEAARVAIMVQPAPVALPDLAKRSTWVNDKRLGNGDEAANPGEQLHFVVRLENTSGVAATNVAAKLTTADPSITLGDPPFRHASWPGGERLNSRFPVTLAPTASGTVNFQLDVTADNGGPWVFTYTLPVVASRPQMEQGGSWVRDSDFGNDDGNANPAERVEFRWRLRNTSAVDAEHIVVTLTSDDPRVTVIESRVTHALWPAGEDRATKGIVIDIAPTASGAVPLTVDVTADNGGPWQFTYDLEVVALPDFQLLDAWINDKVGGNGDGDANPGETFLLRARMRNVGQTAAGNVRITLSTATPGVTILRDSFAYATWSVDEALSRKAFRVEIGAGVGPVDFTMNIAADNGGPWEITYSLPVVPIPGLVSPGWRIRDVVGGNSDELVNPGERIQVIPRLKNDGSVTLQNVVVTLTSADSKATIAKEAVTRASWPAGAAYEIVGLVARMAPTATGDAAFRLRVTSDNGGPWEFAYTFAIVPTPADFVLKAAWAKDNETGDADKIAEPGEQIEVRVRLRNEGQQAAQNVVVNLSSTDSNATVVKPTYRRASWDGKYARNTARLIADLPQNATTSAAFLVLVTADDNMSWQFEFTISIGASAAPAALRAPEDVDGDGSVGLIDILAFAPLVGTAASERLGPDVNGDGALDFADIIAIHEARSDIGAMAPAVSASALSLTRTWIDEARARDDGSPVYRHGLPALARILRSMAPTATVLLPNYPNPFNPETWIPFDIAEDADATLRIYDVRGGLVRRLELGRLSPGSYRARGDAAYWDGRNDVGEQVASGVYVYELQTGSNRHARRMVVRK